MKLDIKSVLIGVLLTVNVLMLLGLNSNDEESQIGRYQVIASNTNLNNIYVMDTTNGEYVKHDSVKTARKEVEANPNRLKQWDERKY